MQEYIKVHLTEDITIAALAREAMFSPWYSYRLFTEYLNMTPADYIRRMRLARSAMRLRDEKITVTELAFDSGFGSVDGYRRAFFKEFGINPREYMLAPVPIYLFTPFGIKGKIKFKEENKLQEKHEVKSVFIRLLTKPERRVIIKRGTKATEYWSYGEEVGCDVWGLLKSMKSISGEPVCLWLPEKYRKPNTSEYVQGVEVPAQGDITVPEGFDVITLPEAAYLSFQGEPFEEEDFAEAINDIWEAEKKYEPSNIGYAWDDENPRIQLEPIGARGYVELMPVKKI